jgi:PAS domain S-box-containing protein
MKPPPRKALSHTHALRILDSIAAGVFTVDRSMRIRYFNRTAERITGIPARATAGKSCTTIMGCEGCGKECALLHAIRTGKETLNQEGGMLLRSGKRIPISITAAALRDDSGRIVGGVQSFRDLSVFMDLRKELRQSYTFEDIVSKNHIMRRLFDILPEIAARDSTVLIQGPSGSGKELFARAIHTLSPRKDGPLITVNCGALPESLLESELFGYVRGAFTDATRDRKGRFALAENGTIFLDEVENLSLAMQIRFLRVLQEREFFPLGATVAVRTNARIVAATKEDLAGLVRRGLFRDDLYYRLNVVKLDVPPLAERREDIPLLVETFVEKLNRKIPRSVRTVSPEFINVLMKMEYPGNVRQLQNIIEHAVVMCTGTRLELHHLPPNLHVAPGRGHITNGPLERAERETILTALKREGWNRTRTAKDLGISRTTLWRKCLRLGLTGPPPAGH